MNEKQHRKAILTRARKRIILTHVIPEADNIAVAFSGGSDSTFVKIMLEEHFKKKITLIYVNHGTEFCDKAQDFILQQYPNCDMEIGYMSRSPQKRESKQEFWRTERYRIFSDFHKRTGIPIVLGHNLNDVAETWLHTSINGNPSLIPSAYGGFCIRPFLAVKKDTMRQLLIDLGEKWYECPSNTNEVFVRNFIRHNLMPVVMQMNSGGFLSTMRNKLQARGCHKEELV